MTRQNIVGTAPSIVTPISVLTPLLCVMGGMIVETGVMRHAHCAYQVQLQTATMMKSTVSCYLLVAI